MFTKMINALRQGELPQEPELAKRLSLAVVKKLGILQAPYLCRSSDQKINPSAVHLLWSAILVGDEEKVFLTADLAWTEELERRPQQQGGRDEYLGAILAELAALVAGTAAAEPLRLRIDAAAGWLGLEMPS